MKTWTDYSESLKNRAINAVLSGYLLQRLPRGKQRFIDYHTLHRLFEADVVANLKED